ncbi:glutaredoxin domain-containing protein [Bifidobacterium favimelis]|uniref:Glutaredoxin domain-containing protein n=1 Tax=Bifidobacterium favimelis TaxID=3122979 RepID=A0ABU8ZNG0_9BIFI
MMVATGENLAQGRAGSRGDVDFYGAAWCGDCRRSKACLDRLGVSYRYHDVESEEGAAEEAERISGLKHIPVIRLGDGSVLVEPSDTQLASALGLEV